MSSEAGEPGGADLVPGQDHPEGSAIEPGTGGFQPGSGAAFLRLLLVIAVGIGLAVWAGVLPLVAVAVALFAMVMLHEAGHMVTAKWSRMKVTEYFVGFGPRLWSVTRGETTYGVKAILVGGYVKILGMSSLEEIDAKDEARTYREATFPRRLAVALAGSTVHFIIAFALLWALFSAVGVPKATSAIQVVGFASVKGVPNPARSAGLRPGDVIVKVNGKPVTSESALASVLQSHPGKPVALVVKRNGKEIPLSVTPVDDRLHPEAGRPTRATGPPQGVIGVELANAVSNEAVNPWQGLLDAGKGFGSFSWSSIDAFGTNFSPHGISSYVGQLSGGAPAKATSSSTRFESVVGVARLADQAVHAGLPEVLVLLADINVFVGLFNLVPLLPLDGGHVAVAVYERIRSRKGRRYHADLSKLLPAAYAVILLMVIVGATAAYLDVTHPLPNPFQ